MCNPALFSNSAIPSLKSSDSGDTKPGWKKGLVKVRMRRGG
jgi:hypothetical protein